MSYLPDRSSIRKHAAASLGIPMVLILVGPEAGTCDEIWPCRTKLSNRNRARGDGSRRSPGYADLPHLNRGATTAPRHLRGLTEGRST